MYLEKVSQCDCMPDVQRFNEWIAYPKQSAPAGEREAFQRLLDDVRDVRNSDDVAFGWDEAVEYFGAELAVSMDDFAFLKTEK